MPPPSVGGVAGDGAAADRQRPAVVDAAADEGRGVAGEGAAADRQRPGLFVVDTAAAWAELPERVLSLIVSVPSL